MVRETSSGQAASRRKRSLSAGRSRRSPLRWRWRISIMATWRLCRISECRSIAKWSWPAAAKRSAIPSLPKNNWRPDFERINTRMGRVARLLFLNSPHNPTGAELSEKELANLVWLAGKENTLDRQRCRLSVDPVATAAVAAVGRWRQAGWGRTVLVLLFVRASVASVRICGRKSRRDQRP